MDSHLNHRLIKRSLFKRSFISYIRSLLTAITIIVLLTFVLSGCTFNFKLENRNVSGSDGASVKEELSKEDQAAQKGAQWEMGTNTLDLDFSENKQTEATK